MPKARLTDSDYCRAAEKLGCEVAAVKAVAEQESLGHGFDSEGRPTVLFERHLFHAYTHGRFDREYPDLSNKVAGGYGASASQYGRFTRAFQLDANAAMMATSWGKFQILGANFAICKFASVGEFVDAMKDSEGRQLDAFCSFVLHNDLDDELTSHDWAGFARGYNGKGYQKNKYDTKIGHAYTKFAKDHIDCGHLSANPLTAAIAARLEPAPENANPAPVSEDLPKEDAEAVQEAETPSSGQESPAIEQTAGVIVNQPAAPQKTEAEAASEAGSAQPTTHVEVTTSTGMLGKAWAFITAVITGGIVLPDWVTSGLSLDTVRLVFGALYDWRYIIVGILLIWFVARKYEAVELKKKQIDTNADPKKGNVVLTPSVSIWAKILGVFKTSP